MPRDITADGTAVGVAIADCNFSQGEKGGNKALLKFDGTSHESNFADTLPFVSVYLFQQYFVPLPDPVSILGFEVPHATPGTQTVFIVSRFLAGNHQRQPLGFFG